MSSLGSQKPQKPGMGMTDLSPEEPSRASLVQLAPVLLTEEASKVLMVEPTGFPGHLYPTSTYFLGSHTAHNLEVTRTIPEILQSVPAHLEIAKETPSSSSEKWEKRPPQGNQMVSFLMETKTRER